MKRFLPFLKRLFVFLCIYLAIQVVFNLENLSKVFSTEEIKKMIYIPLIWALITHFDQKSKSSVRFYAGKNDSDRIQQHLTDSGFYQTNKSTPEKQVWENDSGFKLNGLSLKTISFSRFQRILKAALQHF